MRHMRWVLKSEPILRMSGGRWLGGLVWSSSDFDIAVMGISYFAINSWQVAALNPPGLAAIVAWEGAQDLYGDVARHGGILSNTFIERWTANTARHTSSGQLPEKRRLGDQVVVQRSHQRDRIRGWVQQTDTQDR